VSYQVFARKYRPQVFDEVLGQDHVVRTLKNAILQQRLAHAYLFVGPRGTGKTSTARILAKALNCEKGPTVTPCGECIACQEISQGISLDVLEIDGASNNSVDQVRELRENVRFAPVRGRYKVYIIDEVHMLTQQAFNALLKTLEEPPAHVIFVFATTEPHKVLPTILSRCQRFDLHRIPVKVISKHLQYIAHQESVQLTPQAAEAVSVAAEGGLRDAESMLDQLVAFCGNQIGEEQVLEVFGLTSEQAVANLAGTILEKDAPQALAAVAAQSDAGRDLNRLLADLLGYFRNLLIYQIDPKALQQDISDQTRQSLEIQKDAASGTQLLRILEDFSRAEPALKWSTNKKLHLEIAIIRAVESLQEIGLPQVLDALETLKTGAPLPSENKVTRQSVAPKLSVKPIQTSAVPPEKKSTEKLPTPQKPVSKMAEPVLATKPIEPIEPAKTPETSATSSTPEQPANSSTLFNSSGNFDTWWPKAIQAVKARRPLIVSWVESATPLSFEKGVFNLGFPETQGIAMESLMREKNRTFLESIITEFTGTAVEVQAEIREGLVVPEKKEPVDPSIDFKNDPLIKKALELFQAEIA
jgi:DNA polymerase III subunit gamma/tau